MIVLGPYNSSIGTTTLQVPLSTDTYAIGLINTTPYFMSVAQAGSYATMAVPPFTADVFDSPLSASQSLQITFTNLTIQTSQFNPVSLSYYIYLYGQNDTITQAIRNGTSTGYPYSLSGLKASNGIVGAISDSTNNSPIQQLGVNIYTISTNTTPFNNFYVGAYLWGFDLTLDNNATTGVIHANFTIGITNSSNSDLNYVLVSTSGSNAYNNSPLIVRFPFPLAITKTNINNDSNQFGECNMNFQCINSLGGTGVRANIYVSE